MGNDLPSQSTAALSHYRLLSRNTVSLKLCSASALLKLSLPCLFLLSEGEIVRVLGWVGHFPKGSLHAVCARYSSCLTITMAVCRYLQSNLFLHKILFKKLLFFYSVHFCTMEGRNSISFWLKKFFFHWKKFELAVNSLFLCGSWAEALQHSYACFSLCLSTKWILRCVKTCTELKKKKSSLIFITSLLM